MGICDTRGQGPLAQWLSLPFGTPEGAWPLSQSTWVQRWGRGHGFGKGKGGFLTPPHASRMVGVYRPLLHPGPFERRWMSRTSSCPRPLEQRFFAFPGSPLLRLLVFQRAAAAAIVLVVAAATAIAAAAAAVVASAAHSSSTAAAAATASKAVSAAAGSTLLVTGGQRCEPPQWTRSQNGQRSRIGRGHGLPWVFLI